MTLSLAASSQDAVPVFNRSEAAVTVVPTDTRSKTLRFVLARLREASTYRGLMLILTGLGVALRPEVGEAIVAFGIAAAGLAGVLLPDSAE
jgi:hypothetical protein